MSVYMVRIASKPTTSGAAGAMMTASFAKMSTKPGSPWLMRCSRCAIVPRIAASSAFGCSGALVVPARFEAHPLNTTANAATRRGFQPRETCFMALLFHEPKPQFPVNLCQPVNSRQPMAEFHHAVHGTDCVWVDRVLLIWQPRVVRREVLPRQSTFGRLRRRISQASLGALRDSENQRPGPGGFQSASGRAGGGSRAAYPRRSGHFEAGLEYAAGAAVFTIGAHVHRFGALRRG